MFQAASQFNALEFPSERSTPEMGITNYVNDRTQGPACALACMASTAFRNYLISHNNKLGQIEENQMNLLQGILEAIDRSLDY